MATSQQQEKISLSVIIPTRNGAAVLRDLFAMLSRQTISFSEMLVVDSSSDDDTVAIARNFGAEVTVIPQAEFDHGGTRTLMARRAKGDILLFMTQDAVPAGTDAVEKLIEPLLSDRGIVVSYGRQLPARDANPFATHLRLFNYPTESAVRSFADRGELGLKTVFVSNSFAAYRKRSLADVGFFKNGLIFGEDTCTVGRLLLQGGRIAYVADAAVYHSHNYTWFQEFSRSFDIGVLHCTEKWLLDTYGRAERHGMRYLYSELSFLKRQRKLFLFPAYVIRNGMKFLGYQLGRRYKQLPKTVIARLSMHGGWWKKSVGAGNAD